MKQLRAIRILLAALFFAASVACLVLGPQVHPMARAAADVQIQITTLKSLTAFSSVAMVTLVWLLLTFLLGRVYCGVVCPIGTYSDLFLRLRRHVPRLNKPFRYRNGSAVSIHILWVYLLCIVIGVAAVSFLIEPWDIARNMASVVNPDAVRVTWGSIGRGVLIGAVAGVISAILLAALALWQGREFCTRYCPIGIGLGYVQKVSLMHIEFDPDRCTSCGRCEEICRSQCIKVTGRYIDQSRCVRCFDCVAECPNGGIRYQLNRNRPATPLMTKTN